MATIKSINLTTLPVSAITNTTATAYGVVNGVTGETVLHVGVYIDTTGNTVQSLNYHAIGTPFSCPLTGLLPNHLGYSIVAYAISTGGTRYNDLAVMLTTAPDPPKVKTIIQPTTSNGKGTVTFIELPGGSWTLVWSGATSGSKSSATTGVTITGLTIGTNYFILHNEETGKVSTRTTVVIAVPSATIISGTSYRLFERTGIGNKALFKAELKAIDDLDDYETFDDIY